MIVERVSGVAGRNGESLDAVRAGLIEVANRTIINGFRYAGPTPKNIDCPLV
jgi:hypothetical protein